MNARATVIALMIATLPAAALAQSSDANATARIDQRQAEQQKRIEQGVQSGRLTGKEAEKLEHGQQHVQKMEDRALKDGVMTRKEARRIEHAQDQQSRKIHREKHDRQHAGR